MMSMIVRLHRQLESARHCPLSDVASNKPRCCADLTYGVECKPAPGSVDDLHGSEPWLNVINATRLPLRPVEMGNRTCFNYTMREIDTFASVAGEGHPCIEAAPMQIPFGMLKMHVSFKQPVRRIAPHC
jgi:hypothetical protein